MFKCECLLSFPFSNPQSSNGGRRPKRQDWVFWNDDVSHFFKRRTGDGDEHITLLLTRSRPIADPFLSAAVIFADISGLTAWASVREPAQVFTLVKQIYNSFDVIARRRNI
jgi:hypothetical protein